MVSFLITLGILVVWGIFGRLAHTRERDYCLWKFYLSLGPYSAWEEDKYMLIFILYILGPMGFLMVYSLNRTSPEKIFDILNTKSFTSYDLKFYEEHIERPYYKKYKINPCDYCGKKDCRIDVYDFYAPCKIFEEDQTSPVVGKRRF